MTPEHNVRKTQYAVTCNIDEECEKVLNIQCHDCAASSGGCKHSIALLMWLHRRSEEPSPTEVACYWAKSKLSKVGTSVKYLTLKDFRAQEELSSDEESSLFLQEVVNQGLEHNVESQLLKHFKPNRILQHLGLHQLMLNFVSRNDFLEMALNFSEFLELCYQEMDPQLCSEAAAITIEQSNSGLWFDLRYARITASKIYDAAHCKKSDDSLVNQILGVTKLPATEAMSRGKSLEDAVIKAIEKKLKMKLSHIGLQLNHRHPIFGASPDAISEEFVVEIKCPQSEKTICNYLTKNMEITAKYKAHVQLQMFLCKKQKALFCVADPNFEENLKFFDIWVPYDEEYIKMLMDAAENFWQHNIFTHLCNSFKK
ncbi:uncharacterized protein LOC126891103 [Diabrotica virgifera virgifera]|uniref:YqaJ viral recombinase domain-containing protein n=1 Tax=Diabrotica virgifera virgifera TaxID=50390 RepID=A0ABM5L1B9_DIAVI|nr:uncharacterized protein LOC126891103 [Diabrotica virgifera virgifera]